MSSPEKLSHMRDLRKQNLSMKRKIVTLEKKLANILGKEGVQLDSEISSDVLEIMTQQPMIANYQRIHLNKNLLEPAKGCCFEAQEWHAMASSYDKVVPVFATPIK